MWPVIEGNRSFVDGWHIEEICDHLEAVSRREITRLIINIPPRHMKSTNVSVAWPTWTWTWNPAEQFLYASYAQTLSVRDSLKCRRVIASPWYQSRFGEAFGIRPDQDTKQRFDNTATGYRIATSVGGHLTGEGGDVIVVDDPHNVLQAESNTQRDETLRWWNESMSTRLNNPKTGAFVIIMQRVHENDLTGHILASETGWSHLCLPAEYEPDHPTPCYSYHKGRDVDRRSEHGELLWPGRFDAGALERLKAGMTSYSVAGQLQQRPAPRGGGMFPVEMLGFRDYAPAQGSIAQSVRYWDKAATEGGGAYTAGVLMHRLRDGTFVIEDVERGQWSPYQREQRIKQCAQRDGQRVNIYVEQEPGSGGKESAITTIRGLAGYKVRADQVTGSKEVRAEPYAAQVEAGNVYLVKAKWNRPFRDEHEVFPAGQYADQVDAAAGAFNKLSMSRKGGTF